MAALRPVTFALRNARQFSTSNALRQAVQAPAVAVPAKKPASVRSGFVGFLLGASLAGAVGWKFLADEYRLTNEALNLDIRGLNESIMRLELYVRTLQDEIEELKLRRK
ncbi:hypothetical protein BJ508DRAFT_416477 [Ascobolus immersus RN42]|uniref:Uncharacterized protein n=1 Tax=Ascobolus immersus RN42 TaxID=1160509 RepID=A0A3N4HY27_ASCIM|nr:hypothetical protein BJ508DRAFT_416477 [Ascobolus immersus RN42]